MEVLQPALVEGVAIREDIALESLAAGLGFRVSGGLHGAVRRFVRARLNVWFDGSAWLAGEEAWFCGHRSIPAPPRSYGSLLMALVAESRTA